MYPTCRQRAGACRTAVIALLVAGCGGGSSGRAPAPDAAITIAPDGAVPPVTSDAAPVPAPDLPPPPASSDRNDAAPVVAADAASPADGKVPEPAGAVVWNIDNVKSIGGNPTSVLGAPVVIDGPGGKALQFDGQKDALFVEKHPLEGLGQFTVEVIFRPDVGGAEAQRFFHMEDGSGGGRVLFEMRLPGNDTFVQDVYLESAAGKVALFEPKNVHPLGAWYHVAAVVDGKRAHHYVNGVEESDVALGFRAHAAGRTSIGVRITRMYFFKGAIRLARFTPRALTPAEFLTIRN
jgi:hypothetical protein